MMQLYDTLLLFGFCGVSFTLLRRLKQARKDNAALQARHDLLRNSITKWAELCPDTTPPTPDDLVEWWQRVITHTYLDGLRRRPVR